MSMFDGILGNIEEFATKLGLPADQVQGMMQQVQAKMAEGGDMMSAVSQVAQEHGISLDSLKGLIPSGGGEGLLAKASTMLDRDGDGNPLNDLGDMAKGLFGGKD